MLTGPGRVRVRAALPAWDAPPAVGLFVSKGQVADGPARPGTQAIAAAGRRLAQPAAGRGLRAAA